MIILFWVIIAVMTAIALGLIFYPLLSRKVIATPMQREMNIELYRERLLELKTQLQQKELTDDDFQREKQVLGKLLLTDVDNAPVQTWKNKPARLVSLLLLVALPIFAIMAYQRIGDSRGLFHYWALKKEANIVKAELKKIKNPQQIINQLKAHLQAYPNSPKGWYLLGRLYLGQELYPLAYNALLKAYQLKPNDAKYQVAFAEAAFFNNKRRLKPHVKAILIDVLKKQPNNVAAINLLAINDYVEKHYQSAVNYWEKLIPMFVAGSKDSKELLNMIAKAQQHIAAKAPASDIQVKATENHNVMKGKPVSIKVTVHLSKKLLAQAQKDDAVYIFAIPTTGVPMPLAVVRKTVADLPLTIELGKGQTMLPGRKLTLNQSVKLVARISKSGRALAEPGDLTSSPDVLLLKDNNEVADLDIDAVVK